MLQLNWWQLFIAGILILGVGVTGGYFIFDKEPVIKTETIHVVDTLYVEIQPIEGKDSSRVYPRDYVFDTPEDTATEESGYEVYEKTTVDSGDYGKAIFRSTTYVANDGAVFISHEWNIEPRPVERITITDTVFVMTEVEVPGVPVFYADPAFIWPVAILLGAASGIVIYNAVKGD